MTQTPQPQGDLGTGPQPEPYSGIHPGGQTRLLSWPVLAWGLWDWGSAAFNAVITTFVFTVYLTDPGFGEEAATQSSISFGLSIAGFIIALLAPVTGQRADRAGRTVFWLGVHTAVVVAISAAMFLVLPRPGYLWFGIALLGLGNIFFELASVNYNGILPQIATKDRIGAVSGLGWGMGYVGGIALLLILYMGFIHPDVGWFGVTNDNGMSVRISMLMAAAWFGLSAIPVLVTQSGNRARRRRQAIVDSSPSPPNRRSPRRACVVGNRSGPPTSGCGARLWRCIAHTPKCCGSCSPPPFSATGSRASSPMAASSPRAHSASPATTSWSSRLRPM